MASRAVMCLLLTAVSTILIAGCSTLVLYPLDKKDIFEVRANTTIPSPVKNGTIENVTTEQHGYFVSDEWLQRVARARVKQVTK